ncbi:ABC transporter related protein [Calothrix sp. PCC 6303]|nr:ABC transporter related protein [Calothrix sp. PCC 6303]
MVTVSKTSQASRKRRNFIHLLKGLLDYGQQYNKQIHQAIACWILNGFFDLAPPALICMAIDVVVKQKDSIIAQLGVKDVFGQFLILSPLTAIIEALKSLFEYSDKRLWRNLSQNILHNLCLNAYPHLQELDLVYPEEPSTGAPVSILSDDINQLERFFATDTTSSNNNNDKPNGSFRYPTSYFNHT